ncbi:hypothetical protein [Nocardia sp. NPDC004722]
MIDVNQLADRVVVTETVARFAPLAGNPELYTIAAGSADKAGVK